MLLLFCSCLYHDSLQLGLLHLAMRQLLSEGASNLIQNKKLLGVESVRKSVARGKMRATEMGICGNMLLKVWLLGSTGDFA